MTDIKDYDLKDLKDFAFLVKERDNINQAIFKLGTEIFGENYDDLSVSNSEDLCIHLIEDDGEIEKMKTLTFELEKITKNV